MSDHNATRASDCHPLLGVKLSEGVGPAPRWWRCDTHGPGNHTAWGCPECVREMRDEIAQLRATLALQKASYEREIALDVAAERERWRSALVAKADAIAQANTSRRGINSAAAWVRDVLQEMADELGAYRGN